MTSSYFSLQALLTRLRITGELLPREYGAGITPREYLAVLGELDQESNGWIGDPAPVVNHRVQNLVISKRLYASESFWHGCTHGTPASGC